jgi:hypothetical protein
MGFHTINYLLVHIFPGAIILLRLNWSSTAGELLPQFSLSGSLQAF